MSLAIECHNLVKTYPGKPPTEAVRGIDLEVRTGECFGVLGPNGAGKTTTIEILEGLLDATSGTVKVLGRSWQTQANEIRERIGVSLQETKLSEKLTVAETLQLFRSFYSSGLTIEQAIGLVSLEEKRDTWVRKLSGGQKQRLAVATALVGDPELVFLDEPTTGLDPTSRRQLWDIIRNFRERGRTVLLTTHYMDEAERLCDRVAIVDAGKVIALGTPVELIRQVGGDHLVTIGFSSEVQSRVSGLDLSQLPTTSRVQVDATEATLTVTSPHLAIPPLLQLFEERKIGFNSLTTRQATLEDVFVALTGKRLSGETQAA